VKVYRLPEIPDFGMSLSNGFGVVPQRVAFVVNRDRTTAASSGLPPFPPRTIPSAEGAATLRPHP
jgi:hypothetical protein